MKKQNACTKTICVVFMLVMFCFGQVLAEPCGDVNSDKIINIIDGLLIAQYYVELNPANFDKNAADTNGDGSIGILDALLVAQYYVGTITKLPGCEEVTTTTSSPGGSTTYELQAEDEKWSSGGVDTNHSGYTGTGFVNTDNAVGEWIEWSFDLSADSTAECSFTYACASDARSMDLSINGSEITNLTFPASGAWSSWAEQATSTVDLSGGLVTIRLTATTSGGPPNMDKMDITITGGVIVAPTETPVPTPTPTPTETPEGWTPSPLPPCGEGNYHHKAIVLQEFTYDSASFRSIHASSIEEVPNGDLVCVYFGGPGEGKKGTVIRYQRKPKGGEWSEPIVLGDGSSGGGNPCWNPVIFQVPDGDLIFWWKVGSSPKSWWGMMKRSSDGGITWTEQKKLGGSKNPDILGPVKNKPKMLKNGSILAGSSRENEGWVSHVEHSTDKGITWKWITRLKNGEVGSSIQPTIMEFEDGHVKMLMRTRDKRVGSATSMDYGLTWTPIKKTVLPHPGAGLDAVTLADGRQLLVYNHTTSGRSHLNVSVSTDGELWHAAIRLESPSHDSGEKSYPAVIQTSDGLVHTTYTYKRRRVKHVVINPECITETSPMPDGSWPSTGPASVEPQ